MGPYWVVGGDWNQGEVLGRKKAEWEEASLEVTR